jgi:3-oxoacyl-[acyl-carrier-protein] synthase II
MDKDRDGFVLGEGAGALFWKNTNIAVARGAKIRSEIGGRYVCRCSSHHSTTSEGLGAKKCLNCLRDAGLKPTDVDGVTVHRHL